jgi:ribosomal-protein-alanine N-acetyltransferase
MFYIKAPTRSDIPAILEIEKLCHARPWDEKAFICELSKWNSGASFFYIAKRTKDDTAAGYITGDRIVDFTHISNISVHPDFRKQGVATLLLNKVEQETIKAGLSSLTLEVRENNEAAVNLYKKFGYDIKGRRTKFYEDRYDGLIMWKRIG